MNKVHIYTTRSCPYCEAAKSLLKKRNVPFEEHQIDENDDAQWEALIKRSGMQTVPQIFYGKLLIGGFQELSRQDQRDELQILKG